MCIQKRRNRPRKFALWLTADEIAALAIHTERGPISDEQLETVGIVNKYLLAKYLIIQRQSMYEANTEEE
jgi:hypothetical protein